MFQGLTVSFEGRICSLVYSFASNTWPKKTQQLAYEGVRTNKAYKWNDISNRVTRNVHTRLFYCSFRELSITSSQHSTNNCTILFQRTYIITTQWTFLHVNCVCKWLISFRTVLLWFGPLVDQNTYEYSAENYKINIQGTILRILLVKCCKTVHSRIIHGRPFFVYLPT